MTDNAPLVAESVLWMNLGNGSFADVTSFAVDDLFGTPIWSDCDRDGHLDLIFANAWCQPPQWDTRNALVFNRGHGTFERVTEGDWMDYRAQVQAGAVGDMDNDNDPNILLSTGTGAVLFENDGDGGFQRVTAGFPAVSGLCVTPSWADCDNDGRLDVFLARYDQTSLLLRNDGEGQWTQIPLGEPLETSCGMWADYDNNGFLDLLVTRHAGLQETLYRNHGNDNRWILFKLVGTSSNRSAIWINQSFDVQSSTDLVSWTPAGTVTNETGNLIFEDVEVDQHQCRYYRVAEAYPNMVWIPPGTFLMGSPEDEEDRREDEGPQTMVTLTKGFWIGKYEVTQGEYLAVMGSNPSWFYGVRAESDYGTNLERPVEQGRRLDSVMGLIPITPSLPITLGTGKTARA